MNRGPWRAPVQWGRKDSDTTERLTQTYTYTQQKLTQHYKAIILQLKTNLKKKKEIQIQILGALLERNVYR